MMPGAIMKTALEYLKQSLSILREIGDRAGLCCATLFNIGHIHMANGEFPEAISAWTDHPAGRGFYQFPSQQSWEADQKQIFDGTC